jgi:hypothetical protein
MVIVTNQPVAICPNIDCVAIYYRNCVASYRSCLRADVSKEKGWPHRPI